MTDAVLTNASTLLWRTRIPMRMALPGSGGGRSPCRRISLPAFGAVLLTTILAGCYTYAPIDAATPPAGASVRARLAPPAAQRLAPSLGAGDARVLTGVVVDAQRDAFTLEVPAVPMGTASAPQGLFQRVNLGRTDVLEVERRTLDRRRTGLVVAAAVVGVGVITSAIIHGQSTGSNSPTEPSPNFTRRLVVNLRF